MDTSFSDRVIMEKDRMNHMQVPGDILDDKVTNRYNETLKARGMAVET